MPGVDAEIPLQVHTPEPQSVLGTIGQLMTLRNSAAEIQQRQQLAEQERQNSLKLQAETEQRNRDLADQNTIQVLSKDPESAKAFGSGDFSKLAGQVQPKTLEDLTKQSTEAHGKLATTHETDLKNYASQHSMIADAINGLKSLGDDNLISQEAPAVFSRLQTEGVIPAGTPIPPITGVKDLDQFAARNAWLQGAIEGAAKLKKTQQETATSAAQQAEAQAGVPLKEAQGKMENLKLQFMQGANPEQIGTGVDAVIDPKKYPEQNTRAKAAASLALKLTGDPKQASEAVSKVAEEIGGIEKAKAEIPGAIQKAVAVAQAEAPIHTAAAVATQRALNTMSGAATASVPPHLISKATDDYTKASNEYADAAAAANQLQSYVKAAQSGNKAAPGLIPISEVRQLVNRVNTTELHAAGSGAGNLLDKIEGWVNGATEGQPIPPDVLKDMDSLSRVTSSNAEQKYKNKISVVNQSYGSKFEPVKLETAPNQVAASSGHKAGDKRVVNGVTYVRDDKGTWNPQ